MTFRDCIKEFRRVPASELVVNEANWRTHSTTQADALRSVMSEVGVAGACLAFTNEDGRLELIDGHLRKDVLAGHDVPVLVLDLKRGEADKLLAFYDAVNGMAGRDDGKVHELLTALVLDDSGAKKLQSDLLDLLVLPLDQTGGEEIPAGDAARLPLLPHEHYDYVVVLARTTRQWGNLCDALGLEPVQYRRTKIGVGRAIDAEKLLTLLSRDQDGNGPVRDPQPEADAQHAEAPEPRTKRPRGGRRK